MKKLFILVAIMMVATVVSVNAANKEMKAIASWSGKALSFDDTPTPALGGESVNYTYKWDTKGLIVCMITVNTVIDPKEILAPVVTTTGVELTLYDSKCKEVGKGTLEDIDAIDSKCDYALEGVMNGKVAVISEVPRRDPLATTGSDKITWYTYQVMKEGKGLKDLCVSPLEATVPWGTATAWGTSYNPEKLTFAYGIVIWQDISKTFVVDPPPNADPKTGHYDTTYNETDIYTKPDFKSCLVAGEASAVAGEASPSVPKIMSLNNSTAVWSTATIPIFTQEVDITIVK